MSTSNEASSDLEGQPVERPDAIEAASFAGDGTAPDLRPDLQSPAARRVGSANRDVDDGAERSSERPAPSSGGDDPAQPLNRSQRIELGLGIVRLGVGGALVVAPRWAGRIWVGPGADGPGSLVFARALGARDVALGLRIIDAVRTGQPARPWIAAGFAADGADTIASLIAARRLTPIRRAIVPLVAAAVGAAGVWSFRQTRPGT